MLRKFFWLLSTSDKLKIGQNFAMICLYILDARGFLCEYFEFYMTKENNKDC